MESKTNNCTEQSPINLIDIATKQYVILIFIAAFVLSTMVSILVIEIYAKTHNTNIKYGRVDIEGIIIASKQVIEKKINTSMTKDDQQKVVLEIQQFTNNLSTVIKSVSNSCSCVLINSAAILEMPDKSNIMDYTQEISDLTLAELRK